MMELKITCSMCGNESLPPITLEKQSDLDVKKVKRRIERYGWIVQLNGVIIDTYCSPACAE